MSFKRNNLTPLVNEGEFVLWIYKTDDDIGETSRRGYFEDSRLRHLHHILLIDKYSHSLLAVVATEGGTIVKVLTSFGVPLAPVGLAA